MALLVYLLLLLALTGNSSAAYCVCKEGLSQAQLQKTLDYACGAGADCTPILQNGGCFQPNTVQDHCSYAVNSYFQKKGQAAGSCDFAGSAITANAPPSSGVASGCVYPSSPGNGGTGTSSPPANPNTGTTSPTTNPNTGTTSPTTTPATGTTTPGTGIATPTTGTATPGTGTGTGTTTPGIGTSPNPMFGNGLGPSGTTSINDNSGAAAASFEGGTTNFFFASMTLWLWSLFLRWG